MNEAAMYRPGDQILLTVACIMVLITNNITIRGSRDWAHKGSQILSSVRIWWANKDNFPSISRSSGK